MVEKIKIPKFATSPPLLWSLVKLLIWQELCFHIHYLTVTFLNNELWITPTPAHSHTVINLLVWANRNIKLILEKLEKGGAHCNDVENISPELESVFFLMFIQALFQNRRRWQRQGMFAKNMRDWKTSLAGLKAMRADRGRLTGLTCQEELIEVQLSRPASHCSND